MCCMLSLPMSLSLPRTSPPGKRHKPAFGSALKARPVVMAARPPVGRAVPHGRAREVALARAVGAHDEDVGQAADAAEGAPGDVAPVGRVGRGQHHPGRREVRQQAEARAVGADGGEVGVQEILGFVDPEQDARPVGDQSGPSPASSE